MAGLSMRNAAKAAAAIALGVYTGIIPYIRQCIERRLRARAQRRRVRVEPSQVRNCLMPPLTAWLLTYLVRILH